MKCKHQIQHGHARDRTWLIFYDVSDDRRRRRVAEILLNYGVRKQLSVFECRFTATIAAEVRERVRAELDSGDRVHWVPLCHDCLARVEGIGVATVSCDEGFWIL